MPPESFGALLKKYRTATGLTQEELAEKAGISTRGISDLERGVRRTPYKGTLELLADALKLSSQEREIFKKAANRKVSDSTEPQTRPVLAVTNRLPLLGRTRELNQFSRFLAGQGPPVLMLTGEPGIGKTRLLNEIALKAVEQGWTILEGSCTRRGGQSLYAPLLEALSGRLSRQTVDQQQIELKECEWLVRLLPELSQSVTPPALRWQLSPGQERRLVFEAVRGYLTNIAKTSGTLLILDDLQWAGGDALDLLTSLIHSPRSRPLRIIGAYRTTEVVSGDAVSNLVADLARQGLVIPLELGPLEELAATELINLLLANTSVPTQGDLIGQLLERTGGIPFYLISYIRGLQTGALDSNTGENRLPWDIKQTIRQRISALPEAAQELLSIAAVIGRVVKGELLLAVAAANRSQREMLAALEAACRARLLLEIESSGEVSYRFAHDLIREVVEADLSVLRYRILHSEVAAVLEHRLTTIPAEVLAYHYRQAGDWKNALRHLLSGIEHARRIAAHREEVELLAEAIECAMRTEQHQLCLELRLQRGKVCRSLAMWAEADNELSTALAELKEIPVQSQAELLVTVAEVRHWRLDTPATRRFAAQAAQLAEQIGQVDLLARALSVLAISDSSEGNIKSSIANFQEAFNKAGNEHLGEMVSGVELYALIYYWLGRFDQSVTSSRQALELGRQTYDATTTARALANLGLALSGKGQYVEAFKAFEEAREFAKKYAMGQWYARATSMYGGVYLDLFNYDQAEKLAQEARQISQDLKWPLAETSSGIDLLFNFVRSGRLEQAEALIEEVGKAVEAGQGAHGWLWRLRFAAVVAELALARSELEKAISLAEQVIEQSRLLERVKYEVLGLQIHGKALARSGDNANARVDLTKAVTLARNTANPAMFLQAAFAFLSHFKDEELLLEARSLAKVTVAGLENEELASAFLASNEIRSINEQ